MRTTYPVLNPGGGSARLGAFPGPGDFQFTPPDLGPGPGIPPGPGPAPEPPAPAPVPPAPVPVPPAPTYLFPTGEGEGEAPAQPETKENSQEPENGMSTGTWVLIGVAGVVAVTGLVVIFTR